MNNITFTSYHTIDNFSTPVLDKYDVFYAEVVKETSSGSIILLELENGSTTPAFTFGNYATGDRLMVTVTKVFDDGRYPRVSVDTVLAYASDIEYIDNRYSHTFAA